MNSPQFIENLLAVLPYWQYKLVKPLRNALRSEMGLEPYYALQTLRQFGPLTMTELTQRLKITKQLATKIVENLFLGGLVERVHDESDRRYIRIKITEDGQEALYRVFRQDGMFLENLEEKIGSESFAELENAIEILLKILPKLD